MAHDRNDLHYRIAKKAVQCSGIILIEPDGSPLASTLEGL